MSDDAFFERLDRIAGEVRLAPFHEVRIGRDDAILGVRGEPAGRWFYQIRCWRRDVITGETGYGFGGKAYLSPHATDSELVQTIFGLYRAYFEHEARETFLWRDRRVFGPHISTEALWDVARRVDVRSARHEEDQPGARLIEEARKAREANGGALPSLDFAKPVGHDGEHLPDRLG